MMGMMVLYALIVYAASARLFARVLRAAPVFPPVPLVAEEHERVKRERALAQGGATAGLALRVCAVGKAFNMGRRRCSSASSPPTIAVADISIAVPFGEVFGLLGPNGAG